MSADDPLAFFLTWSTYGTHLQGDEPGWRRRGNGFQPPQPRLAAWRRKRLINEEILLNPEQRDLVAKECQQHCIHRGWLLWVVNARTNHVHAVVTAPRQSGKTVRDQLKANCTRALRERWTKFADRPVWTTGGDWKCLNDENAIVSVCQYVRDAQDRATRR